MCTSGSQLAGLRVKDKIRHVFGVTFSCRALSSVICLATLSVQTLGFSKSQDLGEITGGGGGGRGQKIITV